MKTSVIEKFPKAYFLSGILFYLFIIVSIFTRLFATDRLTYGTDFYHLFILMLEFSTIIWLAVFHILNPRRIWKLSKKRRAIIFASEEKLKLLSKIFRSTKEGEPVNLAWYYFLSNFFILLLIYCIVRLKFFDPLNYFRLIFDFYNENLIPIDYKLGFLYFLVINVILLCVDKNQEKLWALRIFRIFKVIVLTFAFIPMTALLLTVIDEYFSFIVFDFDFKRHIAPIFAISVNAAFIICELDIARSFLCKDN